MFAVTFVGGCAHSLSVPARVIEPAGLPVRAFPHVWIERGQLPAERDIAESIATYLQQTPGLDVRLLDADQLAAARAGGMVPAATVVLSFRLQTAERMRVEWTTRPETVCDALGCFSVNRSYNYDVPVLEGELTIMVSDGVTSQTLQRALLKSADEGRDYDDMLPRIAQALATRLQQLTEQRARWVEVTLLEVDAPDVEVALVRAEQGDWVQARQRLDAFIATPAFAQLDPEQRARVLYDVAQARRFGADNHVSAVEALRGARTLLQQALQLDHDAFYAQAIGELDRDLERRRMVEDQRAATQHNFAIEAPVSAPPPPPADAQTPLPATSTEPVPATGATPQTP